jgi:hypothetical protein
VTKYLNLSQLKKIDPINIFLNQVRPNFENN